MAINWDTLERDFSGLTDGQNIGKFSGDLNVQNPITPDNKKFSYWGEKGRGDLAGYGTEGDTGITRGGLRDSSARLVIAQGWDGLAPEGPYWSWDSESPDYRPTTGQLGGGLSFDTPLGKGQTMHAGVWMYVPADFDFRAESGFLKTLRFTRSDDGGGGKMEIQPASSDGSQSGWNLQDETFQTQLQSYTLRDSSRVLIRGQWNFIAFSAYLSDVSSELIKRLWVNDELAYEQIGETNGTITARWYDSGWQTANFTATTGNGAYRTLKSADDTVTGMMLFTYWNGGIATTATSPWPSTRGTEPYQDQSLNIDSVVVHANEADLGTDASGNKYIASTDVFPTSTTGAPVSNISNISGLPVVVTGQTTSNLNTVYNTTGGSGSGATIKVTGVSTPSDNGTDSYGITSFTIEAGGSGYVVGDVLTVNLVGLGISYPTFVVAAVGDTSTPNPNPDPSTLTKARKLAGYANSITLTSPDGTQYTLGVSNEGGLTTTAG